ncbi:hypothetical protein LC040_05290 [Bacillus tianshenii]|nr:hypothetical protein LC040_05290 [Bacillus tianshenii]
MKVHAKLEAALEADRRYWFQVQPNDKMLELKVFDEPISQRGGAVKGDQAAQALLKQFNLPASKQNTALVQHFLKEGLPFTKENLQLSSEWLKGAADTQKALASIQTMLEKNLPFTKGVFDSIQALSSKQSFSEEVKAFMQQLNQLGSNHKTVQSLQQQLTQVLGQGSGKVDGNDVLLQLVKLLGSGTEQETQAVQSLLTKMGASLGKGTEPFPQQLVQALQKVVKPSVALANQPNVKAVLTELINTVQQSNATVKQQAVEQLLQVLFPKGTTGSDQLSRLMSELTQKPLQNDEANLLQQLSIKPTKETRALELIKTWSTSTAPNSPAHQLLQRSGILPQNMSRQEALNLLQQQLGRSLNENPALKHALGNPDLKSTSTPQAFIQQMIHAIETNVPQASQERAINLLIGTMMKALNTDKQQPLLSTFLLSNKELEVLQSMRQQVSGQMAQSFDTGNDTAKAFKQILNLFGFNHENMLVRQGENLSSQDQMNNIKSLLMRMAQENLSPQMQERVEHLLQRITGQQLVASEQNGPMQQLMMHIPLTLGNHMTDLNIQWSGKKQQNGQIDPNYCRVLFYLDLESLKETVIDVNIQNRIMNIHVYNDTPELGQMAKAMQPLLKENLEKHNYNLSSLKITEPSAMEQQKTDSAASLQQQSRQFQNQSYTGVDFRV